MEIWAWQLGFAIILAVLFYWKRIVALVSPSAKQKSVEWDAAKSCPSTLASKVLQFLL
jgi:hypothetical protein